MSLTTELALKLTSMESSLEYRAITNCARYLEIALQSDRDIVHFLNLEGFITQEVCDDVLNPRPRLTERQNAGQLVTGIRNAVLLSPRHYSTLLSYFRADRARYGGIVDILDREYHKQQQSGVYYYIAATDPSLFPTPNKNRSGSRLHPSGEIMLLCFVEH